MKRLAKLLTMAAFMAVSQATYAADAIYGQQAGYCVTVGDARIMSIPDNAGISSEVVRMMDHAIAVSEDSRWLNSSRPVFLWASETRAACGIAYGYLKAQHRDDEFLNKCECFHDRMVQYMN